MSIILNTEDMVAVASRRDEITNIGDKDHVMIEYLIGQITAAQTCLADIFARLEGVEHFETSDQQGFGGLCSTFHVGPNGKTSDLLSEYDTGGDWE